VILDSGPLGRIAHPKANHEITKWLQDLLTSGATVVLPEIADYEVRRNLLLEGLTKSVARLDDLKKFLMYVPLTTQIMLRAAELWGQARTRGFPTADPKELDADVILAAQAESCGSIVATENLGHPSLLVR
jgi:predicted nucleic acid-binding protein